jgi:hypothetical protein
LQGRILFDLKRFGEALQSLDKSLALGNADLAVYRWKGQTLDSLGRHDEALAAYEKAKPPVSTYHGGVTRITSGAPQSYEKGGDYYPPDYESYSTAGDNMHVPYGYTGEKSGPAYDNESDWSSDGYSVVVSPNFYRRHRRGDRDEDNILQFIPAHIGATPSFIAPAVPPLQQGAVDVHQNGSALPPINYGGGFGGGHSGGNHGGGGHGGGHGGGGHGGRR